MPHVRTPIFPHRRNQNGSFESICPGCFLTVARAETEADLRIAEAEHVCECSLLAERGVFYSLVSEDSRSAA
jgi:hypothetical protein